MFAISAPSPAVGAGLSVKKSADRKGGLGWDRQQIWAKAVPSVNFGIIIRISPNLNPVPQSCVISGNRGAPSARLVEFGIFRGIFANTTEKTAKTTLDRPPELR